MRGKPPPRSPLTGVAPARISMATRANCSLAQHDLSHRPTADALSARTPPCRRAERPPLPRRTCTPTITIARSVPGARKPRLLTATCGSHHATYPGRSREATNCGLLAALRRRAERRDTPLGRCAADFHSPTPTRTSQVRRRDEQKARPAGAALDRCRSA
jgi:hypothetical protein